MEAKGRRTPRPVTPGTTKMGLVLDYHPVPLTSEGFQESTVAHAVDRQVLLPPNARRRKVDQSSEGGLDQAGTPQEHHEGHEG